MTLFDDAPKLYCQVCDRLRTHDHFFAPHEHICDTCTAELDPTDDAPPPSELYQVKRAELTAYYKQHQQLESEMAGRVLARRRLLPFIKRFKPLYQAGWVHEDICRRLERFMAAVERKEAPRMLLMMPVRMGKSEIGSRHFAPWMLGHHPEWEIIAASGGQPLAITFSRYIRDLMRDPLYTSVFPDTKLSPDSQSVENWNTTSGGGYMAAGIGTMIVGRGAHVLLIDDPITSAEAADSAVQREAIWEWYIANALNRLAPGGGVLGIMTHWNEDDWAGRVETLSAMDDGGDKFEIVRYPAINDVGDEYILADESIEQFPPGTVPPEGARMTRPINTPLELRYTMAMLQNTKATYYALGQQRWWAALYQQNPSPEEGVFFTKDMLQYGNFERKHDFNVYQAWDFAITEKQVSDWTACATIWQTPEGDLIIAEIRRFRSDDGENIVDRILDAYEAHRPNFVGFEDGQIWKSLNSTFTRRSQERKLFPAYDILPTLTDKRNRAGPLKGLMQSKKIFVQKSRSWTQELVKELLTFGAAKHDDQVDACAHCVRVALQHSARRRPEPKKLESWRDKLPGIGKVAGASHMAA